jgi:hypothetical protein
MVNREIVLAGLMTPAKDTKILGTKTQLDTSQQDRISNNLEASLHFSFFGK